ncbi:MAG: class I SAM-dependent methyltransferase [Vicinamibacterales bacterium]
MSVVERVHFQLWRLRDRIRDCARGRAHRTEVFQRIHNGNLWAGSESVSGSGSDTTATEVVRDELPVLFRRLGVHTVLDAPCGDFFWMREVVGSLAQYTGVDIVPELIQRNEAAYASTAVSFLCADITVDRLPPAELILCRDCFIHLPTRMIRAALRNFRSSGARYLLLTSDRDAGPYHDIPIGSFRPIDFTRAPFHFPAPVAALSEEPEGSRQLCLWELRSLPVG